MNILAILSLAESASIGTAKTILHTATELIMDMGIKPMTSVAVEKERASDDYYKCKHYEKQNGADDDRLCSADKYME